MPKSYRILSWNINGLRAVLKKDFISWFKKDSADVLCLQEIKATQAQLPPEILQYPDYHISWNSAERLGYSGVATFSKDKPVRVNTGCGLKHFDCEGRVIETEFPEFTLFNIYFPNGKMNPERLKYKMDFYEQYLDYFVKLRKKGKKLVVCGDVNTAHKEIDLARPRENSKTSGFLPMEREWIDRLISKGFVDSFRVFDQNPGKYTWWDTMTGARARNVGWRIDYHFISEDLRPHLKEAFIMPEVMGSDHCPVGLTLRFP